LGSPDEALKADMTLRVEYDNEGEAVAQETGADILPSDGKLVGTTGEDVPTETGRLVEEEEKADGHISWTSCEFIASSSMKRNEHCYI
jgi:hypothetical protein